MTEKQFIEENQSDWKELERLIKSDERDPDRLHALFVKVSGDLSYAQTYFPRRSIRWYLNGLNADVFDFMRRKEKMNLWQSILNFYNHKLPSEIIRHKEIFIFSFFIFILAASIGSYSTFKDERFAQIALGPRYVAMTEENIKKDDPMAVYKQSSGNNMFFGITFNNIRVAFLTFVTGIFLGIGSIYISMKNGIMVGAFQTFFIVKKVGITSALTIWIHGTIEITSIIIASAAGLIIGKHLLLPGTFSRIDSLKIGAIRGLTIMLSTVPLFVIAGFFESYVTPKTEYGVPIKLAFILLSLVFVLWYYLIQPIRYYRSGAYIKDELPITFKSLMSDTDEQKKDASFLKIGLADYRTHLETLFKYVVLPLSITVGLIMYLYTPYYTNLGSVDFVKEYNQGEVPSISTWLTTGLAIFSFCFSISTMTLLIRKKEISSRAIMMHMASHLTAYTLFSIIYILLAIWLKNIWFGVYSIFIFPYSILTIYFFDDHGETSVLKKLSEAVNQTYANYKTLFPAIIVIITLNFLLEVGTYSISDFLSEFVTWHNIMDSVLEEAVYINHMISFIINISLFPLSIFCFHRLVEKIRLNTTSHDLEERYTQFIKAETSQA